MRSPPLRPAVWRTLLLPVLALAVGACADEPITEPAAPAVASFARAAATAEPDVVPNGVPYRDPAYRHATGRSGGAELSARALLGKDGLTVLEVTTGTLDAEERPPHDLTKVQVKLLETEDAEEAIETRNYNDVAAGGVAYTLAGLPRHHYLQVQGNVRVPNASGKKTRTGVVTLKERISLRPDLAASDLGLPAQAFVNTVVDAAVRVSELNGDVAATASCVLYVDGAEADRAEGIWVAEGDAVDCLFSHVFDETGTYAVDVAVEDVVPGDWDGGNNRVSADIEIVDPATPLQGWAEARETHHRQDGRWKGHRSRDPLFGSAYSLQQWDYTRSIRQDYQITSMNAWADGSLSFPAELEIERTSGGAVVSRRYEESLEASWSNAYEACHFSFANAAGTAYEYLRVCSHAFGQVSIYSIRRTGMAAYTGSGFSRTRPDRYSGWTYYSFIPTDWDNGPLESWGSDFSWNVSLSDGSELFVATPTVTLTPYADAYSAPWSCSSYKHWEYYGYTYGSACHEYDWAHHGRIGNTTF